MFINKQYCEKFGTAEYEIALELEPYSINQVILEP